MENSIVEAELEDHRILAISWAQALHYPALDLAFPFQRLREFVALISIGGLKNGKAADDKIEEACEAFDLQLPSSPAPTLETMWYAADETARSFKRRYDQLQTAEKDIKAYVAEHVGKSSKLDLESSHIAASVTAIVTSDVEDFKTLNEFAEVSEAPDGAQKNPDSRLLRQIERLEKNRKELEEIKHSLLARTYLIRIENKESAKGEISLDALTLDAKNKDATSAQSLEVRSGYLKIVDALNTALASLKAAQTLNQDCMKQVITKHSMLRDEQSRWAYILSKVAYVHKSAKLLQVSDSTYSRIEIFKHVLHVINEGAFFQGKQGVTAELKQTLETLNVVNKWETEETGELKKLLPMMETFINEMGTAISDGGEIPKPLDLVEVGWEFL